MKQKKKAIKIAITINTILLAFLFLPKYVFAASLVINEIMYDLAGTDDKHEWVEIYNAGATDIDLTDHKFNDGDSATNHGLNAPGKNGSRGSLVIPAGGFLLLAGDAQQLTTDLPNYTGTIIDTVMSLNNTSATLKILDKDNVEINSVSYNKNMGANGNSKTLEWDGALLKESYIDGGTPGTINSVLGAIPSPTPIPSTLPTPTPTVMDEIEDVPSTTNNAGTETAYQYSQDIYLNEFLPYPVKDQKEWLEIYNLGQETINLTGWQIDDEANTTKPQIIPDETKIGPNEFLVIELPRNILNNDGDEVRLLWPDDQVVHSVSYAKSKQNMAVARFNDKWLWTNQPTPGAANKKTATQNTAIINNDDDLQTASANNAPQIATRQDAVLVGQTNTASQTSGNKNIVATPLIDNTNTPNGQTTNNENLSDNNLSANIQGAIGSASWPAKLKTILTLSALIIFSGLAATGLIYFKRRQSGKIDK
ncbi:MAG: hypothetical protein UV36_C0003G0004 [Parcubacteria group bacterium GW2011_GWC2_42_6]|nr:MAG: hypothetical protein UU87_C0003G0064 [Parcubacteria group bacterium GW2011_GWA2_42_11]KKS68033.1 MAG: hypothetical protein UV36_C0003G0004 [Parcubacteria group bacterium GW2011_GWC2_42_6]